MHIKLKRAQTRWDPWKAMAAAFTAGAALSFAVGAVIGYLFALASGSC